MPSRQEDVVKTVCKEVTKQILSYAANPFVTPIRCSAIAETALQGALFLARSGRLELGDDILRTL